MLPLKFSQDRGVAQPGSVLAWGARGRVFESHRPDQLNQEVSLIKPANRWFFYVYFSEMVCG